MLTNNLTLDHSKLQKLFDTCNLEGKWKQVDKFIPRQYVALEDKASIHLSMIKANYTESFAFKKNSRVIIRDSIAEFHEKDIIR